MRLTDTTRNAFAPVLNALDVLPPDLAVPGLLVVRPGYRYIQGVRITATPAIVLAVAPAQVAAARLVAADLEAQLGVPVEAQEASIEEQLAAFDPANVSFATPARPRRTAFEDALRGKPRPPAFAPKSRPDYRKPKTLRLRRVKEKMQVTLSVS